MVYGSFAASAIDIDRASIDKAPEGKFGPTYKENRIEGSIRKLKQDRGFGFIAGDDGQDHFFHWTSMEKNTTDFRQLEIQDRVSFISIPGDKGPRAIQVRVL